MISNFISILFNLFYLKLCLSSPWYSPVFFLSKHCRKIFHRLRLKNFLLLLQSGAYVLNLFDWQSGGVSLLFLAFFESLCIGWFYGSEKLRHNVFQMTGSTPGLWWMLCWKYFSPCIIFTVFIFSIVKWNGVTYNTTYRYPVWAEVFGWLLALSSMVWLPIGLVSSYISAKGSFQEVSTWYVNSNTDLLPSGPPIRIILLSCVLYATRFATR